MDDLRPEAPVPPVVTESQAPVMGPFQKLINVFLAPTETFEAVRVKPDWWLPLILITLVSAAAAYVITPKMDMTDFFRSMAQKQGDAQGWDDARIEQQVEEMKAQGASQGKPWVAFLTTPVVMALITLVLWGAMRAAGGVNTFMQTFGAVLYGWMPNVIKGILVTVFAARASTIPFVERNLIVKSNLAFLASPTENPVLHAALSWIDLFSIWTLVLVTIGLAVISRFSVKKVGLFMAILYAVLIGLGVGFVALMSSFMG